MHFAPLFTFFRLLPRLIVSVIACAILLFCSALMIVLTHFDGTGSLPAECAVVFGAAVYGKSNPGPAIVRRVSAAAAFYRQGMVKTLIMSGGKGSANRESEARVMRAQALLQGVADKDIILEEQAHSTKDNILFSRPLAGSCATVVGISDQYHLARIELLARQHGWGNLKTIPAAIRPTTASERRSIVREALGYLYYAFRMDSWLHLVPAP